MNLTPRGCSSIGGELALCMERTRDSALSFFASHGYAPFNPAELQLLDGAVKDLSRGRRKRIIALNSPFGEPCCLRADITVSALSYMAAHYAPDDFPLRLCYAERIFSAPVPPKENIEDTQVGVELLGWESEGCDVEVAVMMMRCLDMLGLTDSVIVLGDASLLAGLVRGLPETTAAAVLEQLRAGEYFRYEDTVRDADDIPARTKDILLELPWMKGTADVLGKSSALFGDTVSLSSLETICGSLESLGYGDRIRIDLGFVRDLSYYTGPIFNVYATSDGGLLGGGGRYAGTLSDARFSCEAIGFGLSLRELALARRPQPERPPIVIWPGDLPKVRAILCAEDLSSKGMPCIISWGEDDERSKAFARKRGAKRWLDLTNGVFVDLETGERSSIDGK